MIGIADTGFLVAFANRKDKFHDWALAIAEDITEPLLTCEAVLAETAFHLQSVSISLAMIHTGLITLAFNCNEHLAQLDALAKRFADREPDLADLCLIRMSELHPRHSVVTIDQSDFRIYRRNKRDTIPLICPRDQGDSSSSAGLFVLLHSPGTGESGARARLASRTPVRFHILRSLRRVAGSRNMTGFNYS